MRKFVYTNNGNMNIYASICFQSCNANGHTKYTDTIHIYSPSNVGMRLQVAYLLNWYECRNCVWDRHHLSRVCSRQQCHILSKWNLVVSVDCRGRAEDKAFYTVFQAGLCQHDRTEDIVLVVSERDRDRFTDSLVPCEMDDTVKVILREQSIDGCCICNIHLLKWDLGSSCDLFQCIEDFHFGIG